jgi:hypothetical protein
MRRRMHTRLCSTKGPTVNGFAVFKRDWVYLDVVEVSELRIRSIEL